MLIMYVACVLQLDGDKRWTIVGVGFMYPCYPPPLGEPLRARGEISMGGGVAPWFLTVVPVFAPHYGNPVLAAVLSSAPHYGTSVLLTVLPYAPQCVASCSSTCCLGALHCIAPVLLLMVAFAPLWAWAARCIAPPVPASGAPVLLTVLPRRSSPCCPKVQQVLSLCSVRAAVCTRP